MRFRRLLNELHEYPADGRRTAVLMAGEIEVALKVQSSDLQGFKSAPLQLVGHHYGRQNLGARDPQEVSKRASDVRIEHGLPRRFHRNRRP